MSGEDLWSLSNNEQSLSMLQTQLPFWTPNVDQNSIEEHPKKLNDNSLEKLFFENGEVFGMGNTSTEGETCEYEFHRVQDDEGNKKVSQVGMVFKCYEEAVVYYNGYAKLEGFGTKTRASFYDEGGKCKRFTLSCCKEANPQNKMMNNVFARTSTKTGCKACMKVNLCSDGLYHLRDVILEHNHPCVTPSKTRLLRSHKRLGLGVQKRLELNEQAGIRPCKSFHSLVVQAGGHNNLTFGEQDCLNHIKKVRRLKLGEGDAEAIHQYFLHMQAKNSNFFYLIDLDEKGRLRIVFWADNRSRVAYQYFNDVISFDTTYLTNKYEMPFAPFVGVNHHRQSILMGCTLLSNETTETYIWLFKTWLSCMGGHTPNAIITDQSQVIRGAIEEVFPTTHHRLCIWHIMKKIPSKFGAFTNYVEIKKVMKNAVYNSLRVDIFENEWRKMIERFKLKDNAWLKSLYDERQYWVPTFVKETFWAGMSSTKRSEGMNVFFDGYINSKTTLKQFVTQYEMALEDKYEKDNRADFDSFHKNPTLVTKFFMEEQISKLYTYAIFKEFQSELLNIMYCTPSLVKVDGTMSVFEVKEKITLKKQVNEQSRTNIITKSFEVFFNENETQVNCICCSFQSRGILCRHALSVLNYKNVDEIPLLYIVDRWKKDFKRKHALSHPSSGANGDSPLERYDMIYKFCLEFAELGAMSNKTYEFAMEILKNGIQKLVMEDAFKDAEGSNFNESVVRDPIPVKRVGRTPQNRKESIADSKCKTRKKMKVKQSKLANDCGINKSTRKVTDRQHVDTSTTITQLHSNESQEYVFSNIHQFFIGNNFGSYAIDPYTTPTNWMSFRYPTIYPPVLQSFPSSSQNINGIEECEK